jgi:hypothetical protein
MDNKMGMSDDQIGEVFKSLGRIEAKIDGASTSLTSHVAHDEMVQKALFERVETLQLAHAKQRGAIRMIGMVGSAVGAGIGYVAEKIFFGHHG